MACGSLANEGLGFGYVKFSGSFGRKRVVIPNDMDDDCFTTPLKRQCSIDNWVSSSEKSLIEALPQDILIRIICGVEHDDLKSLFNVSKPIRDATLIAKQWHFAYSTPTKKLAVRDPAMFEEWGEIDEIETPNAPKQLRVPLSRLIGKQEVSLPKRALFMEIDTEM